MNEISIYTGRPELPLSARAFKRAFDIGVALSALCLLAPLLVVVSYAVWRDSDGRILFLQKREGYRNKIFKIFKFRTMISDADRAGFHQARKRDPRVTRIGSFLRKSSIDELPQLLNVLAGDMSIVGPRPHVSQLSNQYAPHIENYYDRLNVRPGLTGLAQVSGLRGETELLEKMRERVAHDLEYMSDWSLLGDFKICVATARTAIGEDAAY